MVNQRSSDQDLRRLAEAHQVAVEFLDWRKRRVRPSPETLRAVLGALGVDASSPAAVREGLREAARRAELPRLPPVTVVRHGAPLSGPPGARVVLETPGGPRALDPEGRLPGDLPLGWHRLRDVGSGDSGLLAHVPDRLAPPSRVAERRVAGLMTQLYSVRSRASWGMGDLADLAALARFSAAAGAGFVLINPLHATEPTCPIRPSPYLPCSRRFASPLYLRIEEIPEHAALPERDRDQVARLAAPLRAGAGELALIDRDAVWQAKRQALELLRTIPTTEGRRAAYRRFAQREGQTLTDFATWCALTEEHGQMWRRWPAPLRDPRSPEVAAEAERLADRVEFHRWAQWLLDEQLAAAQQAARDAGMPVGVLHDLAVGANPDGADAWMYGHVLADGATVGAPPDDFNRLGQDWQQPPWHPGRLAEAGYVPYRDQVGFWLRHGGGLRADHVMGLFRLWWVPSGASAAEGAYVRYDHEAMVGILALEAHLADAVVVGEDLGTVEPWVRSYLASRGILGTSLLWFEAVADGSPKPPSQWRAECLATVDTHDMPPVPEFVSGAHIALREQLGLLGQEPSEARAELSAKLEAWRRLLIDLGLLTSSASDVAALTAALHAFLARTPAHLVGLALTDLVGERRSQNLPGTDQEYPNWRVPLGDGDGREVLLDDLVTRDDVADQIRAVTEELARQLSRRGS